jgi:hypothetical protein
MPSSTKSLRELVLFGKSTVPYSCFLYYMLVSRLHAKTCSQAIESNAVPRADFSLAPAFSSGFEETVLVRSTQEKRASGSLYRVCRTLPWLCQDGQGWPGRHVGPGLPRALSAKSQSFSEFTLQLTTTKVSSGLEPWDVVRQTFWKL